MKETLKIVLLISIAILIVLGLAFYWFQWRPTQIRKQCGEENIHRAMDYYERCLHIKGLEK